MKQKLRLDLALVQLGLAESREKAQALVLAGKVLVNGQKVEKAGRPVVLEDRIETLAIRQDVARSAEKLRQAFEDWPVSAQGELAVDVGSSTGGFTQVLLEQGAEAVLAIDVGKGLMHHRIASDPRVSLMEETNARNLVESPNLADRTVAVVDVSFISLKLVLPSVWKVCTNLKWALVLVKPQFEVGREQVGKGGIVKDEVAIAGVLSSLKEFAQEREWETVALAPCKTKGTKGNQEYIWWIKPKT